MWQNNGRIVLYSTTRNTYIPFRIEQANNAVRGYLFDWLLVRIIRRHTWGHERNDSLIQDDVIIGLLLFLPNCLWQEITHFIVGETCVTFVFLLPLSQAKLSSASLSQAPSGSSPLGIYYPSDLCLYSLSLVFHCLLYYIHVNHCFGGIIMSNRTFHVI